MKQKKQGRPLLPIGLVLDSRMEVSMRSEDKAKLIQFFTNMDPGTIWTTNFRLFLLNLIQKQTQGNLK